MVKPTHLKNMPVKMASFSPFLQDENSKKYVFQTSTYQVVFLINGNVMVKEKHPFFHDFW